MDIIQSAIDKKRHMTADEKLRQQSWDDFYRTASGKKVFLFGLGAAGSYFMLHYHHAVQLEGMIDNDTTKQGRRAGELIAEAMDTTYENIMISDCSILQEYQPEEVVVLITGTVQYASVIEQLEQMGIVHYYVLLMMEVNRRKEEGADAYVQDADALMLAYTEECCKKDIEQKKIVISIGYYGGHGKYISEQLLKLDQTLEIVWVVKDLSMEHPQEIRLVYESNWKRYLYEMETAHIWIYDIALPISVRKRPGQIYIQTKHWSSITLKKFFLDDVSTTNTAEEIEKIRHNGAMMDYIFSGSRFDEETCRSGFAFQGEFVRVGSARTDALFRMENKEKVYSKYHIEDQIRCVLYAPTFRYSKEEQKKSFRMELDFLTVKRALERRFGGEWFILLRLHPSIAQESRKIAAESFVVDVSDYEDCQELLAASDVTISDYSSIMFEHAFRNKPVFLFAPDREEYVNRERDLLIEYEKLPFPQAETNEVLADQIINFQQETYQAALQDFMNQYEIHEDGHASERAARFILYSILGQ